MVEDKNVQALPKDVHKYNLVHKIAGLRFEGAAET
jgi:hypothetical protein